MVAAAAVAATSALDKPMLRAAQSAMSNDAFKEVLLAVPGYDGDLCGSRLDMQFLFQD